MTLLLLEEIYVQKWLKDGRIFLSNFWGVPLKLVCASAPRSSWVYILKRWITPVKLVYSGLARTFHAEIFTGLSSPRTHISHWAIFPVCMCWHVFWQQNMEYQHLIYAVNQPNPHCLWILGNCVDLYWYRLHLKYAFD